MAWGRTMKRKPKPSDRQAELGLALYDGSPTLRQRVDYYLRTHISRRRHSTQRHHRHLLETLVEDLSPYPTPGEIALWVTAKLEGGQWRGPNDREPRSLAPWAESTLSGALRAGSHVCRHARHQWPTAVCPDPFDRGAVTRPVPRLQEARHVPPEVFVLLFRVVPRNDEERAALCLLYYHGLRQSELHGLEECHVDLAANPPTVTILRQRQAGRRESGPLKGNCSAATLALHPETLLYLRRYLQQRRAELAGVRLAVAGAPKRKGPARHGEAFRRFLFPWSDYHWSNKWGSGLIDRCRKAAPDYFPKTTKGPGGRGGVGSHAFRHSLGVAFAEADVNPARAAKAMRHADGAVTETSYYRPHKGQRVDPAISAEAWAKLGVAGVEAKDQAAQQEGKVVQLGKKRSGK